MHAMGSPEDPRAIDVAPIPGVSFDQYVSSIKQHGVPVAQAFDEATHPFPWTTGPNWHIASGDAQVAQPKRKPMTLASLAGASQYPVTGGIDPLAPNPPPYYPQQPQAAPQTLADLGASKFPVANGGDPLAPQKKHNPFSAGNILGVLGDALMAYGGLKPTFGPGLMDQQQQDRKEGFDREKLNATIALAREKALAGPQPSQTERLMQRYLDPATPPQEKALIHSVLMRPLVATVTAQDGSQTQQPYYPDQAGSEDDWEYSN